MGAWATRRRCRARRGSCSLLIPTRSSRPAPTRPAPPTRRRPRSPSSCLVPIRCATAGPRASPTPAAFAAMRAAAAQGLVIVANPTFYRDAASLAQLALEAGLPTVCEWAEMAQSGCMLGYGPNRPELRRRLAHFVARIFQGAAPGDLPIEQPTHYEFVINLKTANALGLTLPPSILARADEVIE